MSLRLFDKVVAESLATTEAEIICIKGDWGVGKTFAWNKYLREAKDREGGIALKRYAYVSLFGITSLDDLKCTIFENMIHTSGIGIEPGLETFKTNMLEVTKKLGVQGVLRGALPVVKNLPYIKGYVGSISPTVMFMGVMNMVICIDDIERRGDKLSIRDVMGLVVSLKEQKRCKIVMILNDDAEERERTQLNTYYEKVVDKSLKFAPSPTDCVRIALSADAPHRELMSECCIRLGISNIRVIRRIEHVVRMVEPILTKFHEGVFKQAVQSIVLMGWCVYEPTKAPAIDYIHKIQGNMFGTRNLIGLTEAKHQPTASERKWDALLREYGLSYVDGFDRALLDGVQNGFFDSDLVCRNAVPLDEKCKAGHSLEELRQAWTLYYDSFDANEDAVADAMFKAALDNVLYLSPSNLNETVLVLRDCGRPDQASDLIRHYVAKREDWRDSFDLERYAFAGDVTDEDIKVAFKEKLAGMPFDIDPSSALLAIHERNGWSPEEIRTLGSMQINEVYAMFKKTRGDDLAKFDQAIRALDVATDGVVREIPRRAREALRLIGGESRLNARRVKRFGVVVPLQERDAAQSECTPVETEQPAKPQEASPGDGE